MLIRHFIFILITISISYADEDNNEMLYNNFEDTLHEGSPCEDKIAAALSNLKIDFYRKLEAMAKSSKITEHLEAISRKLDALEKKIPEKFDDLENKINKMGKQYHDLEDSIQEKFHKVEKTILEKLEEYVDGKLDLLEKHISRRIDSQEKILPDKADIHVINNKLDLLKNIQPDFNGKISQLKIITNETWLVKFREEINQNLKMIQKNISEIENTTTYLKMDTFDNNFTIFEKNLSRKWENLKNMIPNLENNIKRKLDTMDKKIQDNFEKSTNFKLDAIEKRILNLKEIISCDCDMINNTLTRNVDRKMDEMQEKIPVLEHNINKRMDTLESLEKDILTTVNKAHYSYCKEKAVRGYSYNLMRMDNNTFNHVALEMDAKDQLTYFEMYIAIKADIEVFIQLSSSMPHNPVNNTYFVIDIGDDNNSNTRIRQWKNNIFVFDPNRSDSVTETPKILSRTKFTSFYVKINEQTLEFGKKGSPPIIKYKDDLLKTVKYIGFTSYADREATFLYDCAR